jgi:hypothetical protein
MRQPSRRRSRDSLNNGFVTDFRLFSVRRVISGARGHSDTGMPHDCGGRGAARAIQWFKRAVQLINKCLNNS